MSIALKHPKDKPYKNSESKMVIFVKTLTFAKGGQFVMSIPNSLVLLVHLEPRFALPK